jgi:hypothetical protein
VILWNYANEQLKALEQATAPQNAESTDLKPIQEAGNEEQPESRVEQKVSILSKENSKNNIANCNLDLCIDAANNFPEFFREIEKAKEELNELLTASSDDQIIMLEDYCNSAQQKYEVSSPKLDYLKNCQDKIGELQQRYQVLSNQPRPNNYLSKEEKASWKALLVEVRSLVNEMKNLTF